MCIFFSGCAPIRKYNMYDYHSVEKISENGEIYVELDGEYTYYLFSSDKTSPYKLLVYFTPDQDRVDSDSEIKINQVQLIDNDKNVILDRENLVNEFRKDSKGNYISYFTFEDLILNYTDYNLYVEYDITQGNEVYESELQLELITNYSEHYSNDWWDAIMGI